MGVLVSPRFRMAGLPRLSLLVTGFVCGALSSDMSYALAQSLPFSPPQVITDAAGGAGSVYATDLDGDGDADVLSASGTDDEVAWYENLGDGAFGPKQSIWIGSVDPVQVYAADLDGDGDEDVLAAFSNGDKVAWYENLGGGSFKEEQVIASSLFLASGVYAVDLDGDGDVDVLSASRSADKVVWYENLGAGAFGPEQVITTAGDAPTCVFAADMDGDGDADVLSGALLDRKIIYQENLGGGVFGTEVVITTSADLIRSVYATDLDGDGDADVLSASQGDRKVAWYENLGGGSFGSQNVISTDMVGTYAVFATDLDGDGDADVLSASQSDDKVAWYENLGGGAFGSQQVLTTAADGARSVYATDLDGDGDADVLSASRNDNTIQWYEKLNNDSCSRAIPIDLGETIFSNVGAGDSGTIMGCVSSGETSDVWFSYTPSVDGPVSIDLSGSAFDTGAAVWSGECGALTQVGCDDDGGAGLASRLSFTASAGTVYYLQIGGWNGASGDGVIRVSEGDSVVCLGNANSTGVGALLEATGSPSVAENNLTLTVTDLPLNQGVLLVNSPDKVFVANPGGSQGDLCIGSNDLGRHVNDILNSGSTGSASLSLDLTSIPTGSGLTSAVAGETRYWQAWYRDVDGAGAVTSNFSSAVGVTFNL